MPEISIIVPVYNAGNYLTACIDSILAQTFTDFELILVDDGSTDGSGAVCDAYAMNDSRIYVIHQENQGQAAARNHAIKQAKGEWFCFVDSDDVVHPQLLERLYRAAVKDGTKLSMCSAVEDSCVPEHFFETCGELTFSSAKMDEQYLISVYENEKHRGWIVWAKLIHKEIVRNNPFTDGRIYEDNAVVCRWLVEAETVSNINDVLYFYRVNPQGTTKSEFKLKRLDSLWALREMASFYGSLNYKVLKTRFCSAYMQAAPAYYWKVVNELSQTAAAADLKKQMRQMMHKNRKYINLTKPQRLAVYEVLYPYTMRLYWLGQAVIRTVKDKGVAGLIEKIFARLRGGKS